MTAIQESLHQILACERPRLGPVFYEKFLRACPAAADFFAETDMHMQGHILVNGLQMVVALAEHNYPAAKSYLMVLGHRHLQRGIPRELYASFRDAMLATLQEFHADSWNADLERDWHLALDAAIDAMLQGYTHGQLTY